MAVASRSGTSAACRHGLRVAGTLLPAVLLMAALWHPGPAATDAWDSNSAARTAPRPGEPRTSPPQPNCGLLSLRALARALGAPTSSAAWGGVCGAYPQETITMLEVRDAAQDIGLPVRGCRMTAGEFLARATPAIVHFKADHFGTFIDSVAGNVRWVDAGERWRVVPVAAFAESFSGYALLPMEDPDRSGRDPALRFRELDFDCGSVLEGSQLEHAFECRNVGGSALRIAITGASYGCTVEPARTTTLEPGESLQVRVAGEAHLARTVHWVEIASSDRVRPVQYLTLRATTAGRGGCPAAIGPDMPPAPKRRTPGV